MDYKTLKKRIEIYLRKFKTPSIPSHSIEVRFQEDLHALIEEAILNDLRKNMDIKETLKQQKYVAKKKD